MLAHNYRASCSNNLESTKIHHLPLGHYSVQLHIPAMFKIHSIFKAHF